MNDKFDKAISAIDARNANDPNITVIDGSPVPDALLYAKRMSAALDELYPDATEPLKIAVRAQHIERWKTPRTSYPKGRAGYHAWRNALKKMHAETAATIAQDAGFDIEAANRVAALVNKQNLAADPETKALEDTACIVFFKYYAAEFAIGHEPEKVSQIVKKTWRKMTPHAQQHALNLEVPEALAAMLAEVAN